MRGSVLRKRGGIIASAVRALVLCGYLTGVTAVRGSLLRRQSIMGPGVRGALGRAGGSRR